MRLLQIIGGQTWPNLLPILAYEPEEALLLTSSSDRMRRNIGHIEAAVREAGLETRFTPVSIPSENPTLRECEAALAALALPDLVNLTGGTKTMSLAAYRFAEKAGVPSFHLDTRRRERPFDDFGTGPQPRPFPGLDILARMVNVRIALLSHGFPVPENFASPPAHWLSFAREALRLRNTPDLDVAHAMDGLREALSNENGKFLSGGALKKALARPLRTEHGTAWSAYLKAAATHGLVRPGPEEGVFFIGPADPLTTPARRLASSTRDLFKLMDGVWFELAVFEHLRGLERFTDVRWSVQADRGAPDRQASGEIDLVAFDAEELVLHLISCKLMGPHHNPLEHVRSLRELADKQGGRYAKADLWIFRPLHDNQRRDLERICRENRVALHVFSDLPEGGLSPSGTLNPKLPKQP